MDRASENAKRKCLAFSLALFAVFFTAERTC